jgi:DNA transformation protein
MSADQLAAHALDLFAGLGPGVAARRMFGGLGFYARGLFFAVGDPDEGRLFLKVDATSRPAFLAAGGQPFVYVMPDGRRMEMASYLAPPDQALEDPEAMLPWARLAVAAAQRAAAEKLAKKGPSKPKARKPGPTRAAKAGRPRSGAARSGSRSGSGRRRGGRSS